MAKKKVSNVNKTLSVRKVQQKYNNLLKQTKESGKSSRSPEIEKIQKAKKKAVDQKVKEINETLSAELFDIYDNSNQKPTKEVREKAAKAQGVTSPTDWIADHEIFYTVLSYGGEKMRLVETARQKMKNQGKKVYSTVFFTDKTSITTSDEKLSIRKIQQEYNTLINEAKEAYKKEKGLKVARGFKQTDKYKELQNKKENAIKKGSQEDAVFLQAIEKLFNELSDEEERTGKYPLVDIISFGISPQISAISVRPVDERDWLEKNAKPRRKS